MSKTKVVHCMNSVYDVYIGRPNSKIKLPDDYDYKWSCPFVVGKDGFRPDVIIKYKEWLLQQPELLKDLHELKGKTLGCWCRPKYQCHGEVLVELVDNLGE